MVTVCLETVHNMRDDLFEPHILRRGILLLGELGHEEHGVLVGGPFFMKGVQDREVTAVMGRVTHQPFQGGIN